MTKRTRVKAGICICNGGVVQPGYVGGCAKEILRVRRTIVCDHPPIAAELNGVLTLCPRKVVHEIVHWYSGRSACVVPDRFVDPAEVYEMLLVRTALRERLAGKSIAQVVNHVRRECCNIPDA